MGEKGSWKPLIIGPPPPGSCCWVSDGEHVWLARYEAWAAGGFTNDDTWEDFSGDVQWWRPAEVPEPPVGPDGGVQ